MATKPTLSREYLYVPFTNMNFVVSTPRRPRDGVQSGRGANRWTPTGSTAITVSSTHPLYVSSIGESLALLVGPTRGDAVTTENLAVGDYQVWVDAAVPTSDERVVRVAGVLSISPTGA